MTADAAPEQAGISLTASGQVVTVRGTGFPLNTEVTVVGSVTGGSGQGKIATDAEGKFAIAIAIPEWQASEQMDVVATAGTVQAKASINVQPAAVASPATGQAIAPPTTKKPATAPTTQPAAAVTGTPKPNGPTGNWKLIFGDDFSGSALDATKWATCYHWGCAGANKEIETQTYAAANVKVSGGKAALIASPGGKASGMIAQKQNLAFTYGYMEMRAQMPKCAGCWPAFWSIPDDLSWPPEIDVMEGLADDSTLAMTNYHWGTDGSPQQSGAKDYRDPTDFAAAYHTFGAEWSANKITWYIDGKKVNEFTNAAVIAKVPMYVVANLAIDGSRGKGTAPAGAQMNVDYIRVWQKA